MADSYVCSGATMKCTMGTSTAKLTVLPDRITYLTGKPQANISDHKSFVNLGAFGRCRSLGFPATASATAANSGTLTPMPCVHNTPIPWMMGKDDYIIKGQPALLKSSTCQCMWGGAISLVTDGQTNTVAADMGRKETEEFERDQVKKSGIDADTVLDGIQLALDAAGFIPGLGAIPDLTNAAISALRGNWAEAGMSVLAAVPVIGDAAAAVKIAKRGEHIAKLAKRCASRNVDIGIKSLVKRGMSVDEAKAFRRGVRNERKRIAHDFYKKQTGWADDKIEGHMSGIDFTKPVKVDTLPPLGQKEITVYQYRTIDPKTGQYAGGNYITTNPNAKAGELGISDTFSMNVKKADVDQPQQLGLPFPKEKYTGKVTEPVPCLQSTAKRIDDTWSMTGQSVPTGGGAEQFFVPNNSFTKYMTKN